MSGSMIHVVHLSLKSIMAMNAAEPGPQDEPGGAGGRLPGDFSYRKGNFGFYFPLATSIVVSIVLTLLMWFFNRR